MTAKSLGMELRTVAILMKRYRYNSALTRECDELTNMHGFVLGYIFLHSKQGDVFQKDIEAEFEMRRSTATQMLKLMEKNGLIIRCSVDRDARLKKIVLTDRAMELQSKIHEEMKVFESLIQEGITKEEMETFFAVTEKIKRNITKYLSKTKQTEID
jgi:DNA-binding MarR family transcriptional regulator